MPYYPPVSSGGGHVIENDGTPLTQRADLNFTGAGVSVADSGGKTVVTIEGGAGTFAVTETEVDFGSTPVTEKTFTVTDAGVTAASKIMCLESGNVATGRVGADSLWDSIIYSALGASGSFTLYARASNAVVGKRKLFYTYS